MPLIQNDLQPLDDARRPELRKRAVAPVVSATGSPDPYVSVVIRESGPSNLTEAGGLGSCDRRELIAEEHSEPAAAAGGSGDHHGPR